MDLEIGKEEEEYDQQLLGLNLDGSTDYRSSKSGRTINVPKGN